MRLYYHLIAWAFRRFYHEFAWTYDTVAWLVSQGLWQHWARAALPFLRGRVLELGCGTGYVQQAQQQAHPGSISGLDESAQMLAHTRRRLQRQSLPVQLVRGVAQQLPIGDCRIDTVLATFPTNYILAPDTLAEIRRVLVPGGRLLIVDSARFTRSGTYEAAVDLAYRATLLAGQMGQAAQATPPPRHPYLDYLEPAGYHVQIHEVAVQHSIVSLFVATVAPVAAVGLVAPDTTCPTAG